MIRSISMAGRGRRIAVAVVAVTAALGLGACAARTTGATNLTATSADLHATARCDTGESCAWYWEYWPAGQPRSSSTKTQVFGPVGSTNGVNVPLTRHVDHLDPGTPYRWVFCGSYNGGANYLCAGPHGHYDSPTADPPVDYETFSTAPGDWSLQPTPNPSGASSSTLSSVSCTSATWCMAVGNSTSPGSVAALAEVSDGKSWSIVPTPNPVGAAYQELNRVSCTSPTSCEAVGTYRTGPCCSGPSTGLIENWNGSVWTLQNNPFPAGATVDELLGVSCTTPTACTAVGDYSAGASQYTLADRWNGSAWTLQSTPNPSGGGRLFAVSCVSASACVAVGSGISEAWDGTTWTMKALPGYEGSASLFGISCTSASFCAAVGTSTGVYDLSTIVEYWNGAGWTFGQNYTPLSGILFDVSCAYSSSCAAVGYAGAPGAPGNALAQRWNGSNWTGQQAVQVPPRATSNALQGVSCEASVPCAATGYAGSGSSAQTLAVRSTG